MPQSDQPHLSYRFDDVVVERDLFRVSKGDLPRTLEPRAFDLLIYLIEHRDRVVEKQELFDHVWKESFVTDDALAQEIKNIRHAIGDAADTPRYIGTVRKRGYRFIGDVIEEHKPAVNTDSRSSIAVLPFANLTAAPENEYFCDGLAEELLNALTRIRDLRVVARTSAFSFKHQQLDVREIARRLNAATVLEGSVQKTGNRLRILTQLINAADGYHLWSERFDREMDDIFAIQDEIAATIIDKLKIRLLPGEKSAVTKRYTDSVDAYHLYLKGRHFWNRRFAPGAPEKAVEYFQQAIAVDPRYGLAYSGLADFHNLQGLFQFRAPHDTFPSARAAAEKALEIDHAIAEAHASLAFTKMLYEWDWPGAEREFKAALELNPGYGPAHLWYAQYLSAMARFDEAIAEVKRAQGSDPRGMVVVPALLTKPDEVATLLRQLECHYLANTDQNLGFALLGDFADAPERDEPGDDELVRLAESGIDALNRRYAAAGHEPFYFFHRRRQWNAVEGCWMGWERKRGKLHEFNRLLRGAADTSYTVRMGDPGFLPQVHYVITLDADTVLPNGNRQRLVAAMAHPLNRPEFDPQFGSVTAGCTIMQPRVEIKPESSNRSLITRVFAGDTGLDLYTRAVSDVYQDLFGDGIYVGKGIYDVDAFERSLQDRVPENALLSHDLFEGGHGRVGLLTDVMLLEDFSPHYIAYMRRAHRWIRGDWQLLPWLFASVPARGGGRVRNRLSALGRWKALDNLRRSLAAPAILGWLVAAWLWMPGPLWLWMLIALLTPGVPVMTSLFDRLNRHPGTLSLSVLMRMRREFLRWLFAVIFLPYEASVCLDAIISTLIRMYVTRKGLLQWTTAAHTLSAFGGEPRPDLTWRSMTGAIALVVALTAATGFVRVGALPAAAVLLIGWLVSPQLAYWISRPTVFKQNPLDASERRQLHRLARRTWLFYEHFVGPEDNWLPPDHFQETPLGAVAHRTSPTNIGLYVVSCLAAYDLGYVGAFDLRLRLRLLFDSLERLERYRGHLLNWNDTRTLRPLPPRYASFVDSGNLAACLIVLNRACAVFPAKATILRERWDGFVDTLDLICETVESSRASHSEQDQLLDHLAVMRRLALDSKDDVRRLARTLADLYGKQWRELDRLLVQFVEADKSELDVNRLKDLRVYADSLRHHVRAMQRSMSLLLPWLSALLQPPPSLERSDPSSGDPVVAEIAESWQSLRKTLLTLPSMAGLPPTCNEARRHLKRLRELVASSSLQGTAEAGRWLSRLSQAIDSSAETVTELLADYEALGRRAEIFLEETDFSFLFDEQRQLCRIGYNVDAGRPDVNYYDLLASESRLASYIAIAKGDLPSSHWMHLGRPLASLDGKVALVSWSGTMFEYFMPSLWMRDYPHTLLDESAEAVLEYQMRYGQRRGVPWGISESGYYRFDAGQSYQYRAFGAAGLGFKRGLGDDMVVAPYASLLALSRDARAVVRNLDHLARLGMMGRYGLYEAVDFTPLRLPKGSEFMRISSYMPTTRR